MVVEKSRVGSGQNVRGSVTEQVFEGITGEIERGGQKRRGGETLRMLVKGKTRRGKRGPRKGEPNNKARENGDV